MSARWSTLVILVAGFAASAGCTSLAGPSPIDDRWVIHETTHFVIHVRPDAFASADVATFGSVLEDQYATSLTRLEARLEMRLFGFLFRPGEGGLRGGGVREGVAYPLTDSFKIGVAPPVDGNVYALMTHEANHVIAERVLGQPGTSFANEGLASALLSERYHTLGPSFFHAWVANRPNPPSIGQLIDDDAWTGVDHDTSYNSSASFLAYLIETHGPAPFARLYSARSSEFGRRFEEVYGQSLEEGEAAWREYLRAYDGSVRPPGPDLSK